MGSIHPQIESNQLLPVILENRARTDPHGAWARFPASPTSYAEGFRTATHLEVVNAINKVAWILEDNLGKSKTFETIAYLGPNDLRCIIVVLAGIKAGFKTFLPSPRNSKLAHISLLTRLECKVLVATNPELPCIPLIVEDYPMKKLQIPSLEELLASRDTTPYPYDPEFEDVKNDPIFVLHTSGSTGIPKPLIYTHMFNTRVANVTSLPMRKGFMNLNTNFQTGCFFSVFPSFHVVGIGFSLIIPAFYDCIPVYPLPSAPPTTASFLEALNHINLDWAFLPPVLIDELGKNNSSLEFVASKIKYLYFTGGAVPSSSGDAVSAKLPLYQVMGSSECAMFPLIQAEGELIVNEWSYIQVHPAANPDFRHRFGNLHELVIVRKPELEKYQAIFTHFPGLQEYETRDLFSPHPTKSGLWKHRARIDDVIVFLNGEKTNPVSFEEEVSRHPEVKSALVVGHQRFEASLLVELSKDDVLSLQQRSEVIERIWPAVHHANTQCPAHARVSKSKILLADPDLPFLRAPKGTVQRHATLNLYQKKLDELYLETETEKPDIQLREFEISDKNSVTEIIRELVTRVTEWKQFDNEDDFFSLGMDSLQVLQLRRGIIAALGVTSITTGSIYANPSVNLLAVEITKSTPQDSASLDAENARIANIATTLQRYENEIEILAASRTNGTLPKSTSSTASEVILLTGSTGAFGSFILQNLLQNVSISLVYCLNRSANSESVQRDRNTERGLATDFPPSRVIFLAADLTKPNFGLGCQTYNEMLSATTRIIHNAWPVDFNKTLQSFKPSLDGVMGLISFAAKSKVSSLFFISSISSVGNYNKVPNSLPLIPESIIDDLSTPAPMGYGESKYISEKLLHYASQKLHITTGAARVGQIAGTAKNARGWNRNEWFPSLVLSSKFIGAVPETLGLGGNDEEGIDWVPIDQLVEVLVELSLGLTGEGTKEGIKIFHPVHPMPTGWKSLLPTVKERLTAEGGTEIKTVSFQEWVKLLRRSSEEVADGSISEVTEEKLNRNPGIKLLDFYESLLSEDGVGKMIKMEAKETSKASEALRGLTPIQNDWLAGWIKGWLQS